ncbi:MAG: hypothetical protein WB798_02205, partial [Nocardioidaceae bacterium]
VLVGTVTAAATALAGLGLLRDVPVSAVVAATGGIHGTNPGPTTALLLAALYLCPAAPALVRARGIDDPALLVARRARLLTLAVVAGTLVATVLFVAQLRTLGTSSYYLLKFVMGLELVLAALVPAVAGFLLAVRLPCRGPRVLRVLAAVLATAAASQAFGPVLGHAAPLLDTGRSGTASLSTPYSATRLTDGILAATAATTPSAALRQEYLALGPDGAAQAFYADAWFHALTTSLTVTVSQRFAVLRLRLDDADDAAPRARLILQRDPAVELVVAPAYVEPLRRRLGPGPLAPRVVGLDELRAR